MIEWTPPASHTASMSQTDVVDHQDTGSRKESAMNATTKPTRTESSAVMLAIDLAKEVGRLNFQVQHPHINQPEAGKRGSVLRWDTAI